MMSLIRFDSHLGFWSPLIFWIVVISVVLTLLFTLAVLLGGLADLWFLVRALGEEHPDQDDDGRVRH